MPYKVESIPLESQFLKRTVKLLPCQKEMVLWWRENKGLSQRELARMFKVSRRTIQFILDPSKHEENLKRRAERGGSTIYYVKEKHTAAIREHRKYKHKILNHAPRKSPSAPKSPVSSSN